MELVEMREAWPEYSSWVGGSLAMPPEGVFVREGETLVGGCCIYPSLGSMVVGYIATHPELSEASEAKVLSFMLSVLDGHRIVTNRFMFVDMVWAEDGDGRFMHRIAAPSGKHGIAPTEIPETPRIVDPESDGDTGAAARTALGKEEPTTPEPAEESAPKPAKKPRAKAKARKKKVSDD